jgi:hypothetical protein
VTGNTLWWHVADRLPDARTEADADAGLLLLLVVASGKPLNSAVVSRLLRIGMEALGWRADSSGAPLDDWQALDAARDTWTALRGFGALAEDDWGTPAAPATPAGIQLARAALLQRDTRTHVPG